MFKFNFNQEEDNIQNEAVAKENDIQWYQSKEIIIPSNISDIVRATPRDQIIKVDYGPGITFSCLSTKEVMNALKEKSDNQQFLDVVKADSQHSDLLPGKYEGGLKTWECTKDLAVYFMRNVIENLNNRLNGKTVLDLGCGTGILGIMCLMNGAVVNFQDYNSEVLEAVTIPNIFLNCDINIQHKVRLYSGDWSSFLELISQKLENEDSSTNNSKFDYILTSETIYNPENYKKLISIFKNLLKQNGSVFVAAKTHYFGVGGNLQEFESVLQKNGLSSSMKWQTRDGVSRGIIEVKHESVT